MGRNQSFMFEFLFLCDIYFYVMFTASVSVLVTRLEYFNVGLVLVVTHFYYFIEIEIVM